MLRPYQQEAVDVLFGYWEKNKKPCVIQAATGFGKSHLIAEIVKRVQAPTLVLQPTKEILEQNYEKLLLAGLRKDQIQICSASAGSWKIGGLTLATIGTIYKNASLCDHFKYIVIDECVDGEHEVLTPNGWLNIKEAYRNPETLVAQYDDGKVSFVKPSRWVCQNNPTDKIKLTIGGEGIEEDVDLYMTQRHRQLVNLKSSNGTWHARTIHAEDLPSTGFKLFTSAVVNDDTKSNPFDRLAIMIAADGHSEWRESYGCWWVRVSFRRERKVKRCEELLKECEIQYKKTVNSRGDTSFCFHTHIEKNLNNINLSTLSANQAKELCEELFEWDGSRRSMNFDTRLESEADFAQALGVLGGYRTSVKHHENGNIRVHFMADTEKYLEKRSSYNKKRVPHPGCSFYCPTVPSSYFVVRKNGFVYVTGNCDVVPCDKANSMYMKFLNELPNARIVGLTATPWRNQVFARLYDTPNIVCRPVTRIHCNGGKGTHLGEWVWGRVIYRCGIKALQNMGFLSPTKYFEAETDWSFVKDSPGRSEYELEQMSQWMDIDENLSRFHQSIAWCMKNGLKAIVFTPNVNMNFELAAHIRGLGGTAATMDSNNDSKQSREAKMRDFRAGKFQFLVNVGMVGRGVDVPSVDAVVLCRPTKSLSLYIQAVGRCLRLDPERPDKTAYILDLAGCMKRFGKAEDVELVRIDKVTESGWQYKQEAIKIIKNGKPKLWDKVT